jgi:hypothetical protein
VLEHGLIDVSFQGLDITSPHTWSITNSLPYAEVQKIGGLSVAGAPIAPAATTAVKIVVNGVTTTLPIPTEV